MSGKTNQIEKLLSDLRNNYLAELPARLDELDNLIVSFRSADNKADVFESLYRDVHSIKGSAGTHTLHILTTICHDFEDQLNIHEKNLSEVSKTDIDIWLKYIDLLRNAHTALINQETSFPTIESELEKLRKSNDNKITYRCLLVGPTKLQKQICETIFSKNNTSLSVANDGYEALGRLLASKYDFLITNHETSLLNGIALIAATRIGSISNRNIQAVLLTSNETLTLNRHTDPDYILIKNSSLTDNLSIVVNEIIEHLNSN